MTPFDLEDGLESELSRVDCNEGRFAKWSLPGQFADQSVGAKRLFVVVDGRSFGMDVLGSLFRGGEVFGGYEKGGKKAMLVLVMAQ